VPYVLLLVAAVIHVFVLSKPRPVQQLARLLFAGPVQKQELHAGPVAGGPSITPRCDCPLVELLHSEAKTALKGCFQGVEASYPDLKRFLESKKLEETMPPGLLLPSWI